MTTHALDTPHTAARPGAGLTVLRYLDLVVLALALPLFIAADLPLLGYAVAAAAWLLQRRHAGAAPTARARASDDPRTMVGVLGRLDDRAQLAASRARIFAVGMLGAREDGLAAGLLSIALFTIFFVTQMVVQPARRGGAQA